MNLSVKRLFDMVFVDTPSIGMTSPSTPRFGPTPPVHPFGPGYAMHPELSRPAVGYLLSTAVIPALVVGTVVGSVIGETAAVESIVQNKSTPPWWKVLILSGN
ncbi:MAG: hypothetical protein [Circoviridae sp.]|nr:MAG: hypothetical protein [Circoviridae sp.]